MPKILVKFQWDHPWVRSPLTMTPFFIFDKYLTISCFISHSLTIWRPCVSDCCIESVWSHTCCILQEFKWHLWWACCWVFVYSHLTTVSGCKITIVIVTVVVNSSISQCKGEARGFIVEDYRWSLEGGLGAPTWSVWVWGIVSLWVPPPQKFFFNMNAETCRFWCILTAIKSLVLADGWSYLGLPKKILRVTMEAGGGQPLPRDSYTRSFTGIPPMASLLSGCGVRENN